MDFFHPITRPLSTRRLRATSAQLGRAATALGSTRNAWLYAASLSRGFEPTAGHRLIAAASLSGRHSDGQPQKQGGNRQAQYYLAQDPGWLRNAGVGLRTVSTRAAFSNVLHIDLAFPLDAPADIKKMQFLVKTKTSF